MKRAVYFIIGAVCCGVLGASAFVLFAQSARPSGPPDCEPTWYVTVCATETGDRPISRETFDLNAFNGGTAFRFIDVPGTADFDIVARNSAGFQDTSIVALISFKQLRDADPMFAGELLILLLDCNVSGRDCTAEIQKLVDGLGDRRNAVLEAAAVWAQGCNSTSSTITKTVTDMPKDFYALVATTTDDAQAHISLTVRHREPRIEPGITEITCAPTEQGDIDFGVTNDRFTKVGSVDVRVTPAFGGRLAGYFFRSTAYQARGKIDLSTLTPGARADVLFKGTVQCPGGR